MNRAFLYNKTSKTLDSGGEELLQRWQQDSDTCLWLDIDSGDLKAEKQLLRNVFGLHILAIQDAQRDRHPPKLETFENNSFLLLKELAAGSNEIRFATAQLALFVGERFLVTRSSGESRATRQLREEIRSNQARFANGCDALAIRLCRITVDHYLDVLLSLEPRLDELESEILEHPADSVLAELLKYKTELKKFRRVFLYHEHVFRELQQRQHPAIAAARIHEITDIYEHQERAGSLAALYYELSSDLAEGYLSVASHRLNQIMKVLTVVMAIFVPLSFLAGIYGMNFENMPELHSRRGYFILLSVMAAIAVTLLLIFRKKQWL